MRDPEILFGFKEIAQALGNPSFPTLLKWINEYPSIPIRKMGSQWTAVRTELRTWWCAFVTDRLDEYQPPVKQKDVKTSTKKGKMKQK